MPQQLLHLLVGLAHREVGRDVDGDQRRDRERQRPGQLAADHLRGQHRHALAGRPPLDHVGAQVVGLDQTGQRTALAQREDVAGGGDGGEHSAARLPPHPYGAAMPRGRHSRTALVAGTLLLVAGCAGQSAVREFPVVGATGIGDDYYPGDGNGGYDVDRYDLDVGYDPATDELTGTALITADTTAPRCAGSPWTWSAWTSPPCRSTAPR